MKPKKEASRQSGYESYKVRLTIPHRLTTLNEYIQAERTNRYKGAQLKREATELVSLYARKLAVINCPAHYTFTWHVKDKRTDPDNISYAQKFIFDGLVVAGKLPNDNLRWVVAIDHRFIVGKEEKVVVDIAEIDA